MAYPRDIFKTRGKLRRKGVETERQPLFKRSKKLDPFLGDLVSAGAL